MASSARSACVPRCVHIVICIVLGQHVCQQQEQLKQAAHVHSRAWWRHEAGAAHGPTCHKGVVYQLAAMQVQLSQLRSYMQHLQPRARASSTASEGWALVHMLGTGAHAGQRAGQLLIAHAGLVYSTWDAQQPSM